MLEDVAADEDEIDLLGLRDLDNLSRARLRPLRAAGGGAACAPTCQSPVWRSFIVELAERIVAGIASRPRLHASPRPGTGSGSASGTGICGCWSIIDPGLRIAARWRALAVRKPYSARSASAGSRRPTTRMAELATMRRSTSLAVCCAPIRMTPRLRPRSAMSSSTSLIGLQPSRGAYLLSSSRTRKISGRALPVRSFSSNRRLTTTPTTKRLARSCRLWMSMTETWFARQSMRCASMSAASAPAIRWPQWKRAAVEAAQGTRRPCRPRRSRARASARARGAPRSARRARRRTGSGAACRRSPVMRTVAG